MLTEIRTKLEEALISLDGSTPIASTSRVPLDSCSASVSTEDEVQSEEAENGAYPEDLGNPLSLLASISLQQQGGEAPQDEFQAWLSSAQRYYGTGAFLVSGAGLAPDARCAHHGPFELSGSFAEH